MLERRSFEAVVGGEVIEIPTTMAVLAEAERLAGVSLMEALGEGRLGTILQGVICAGMRRAGREVTCEEVGAMCDFAETQLNYFAFIRAMSPNTPPETGKKNAGAGSRGSTGSRSSATPTDSSS